MAGVALAATLGCVLDAGPAAAAKKSKDALAPSITTVAGNGRQPPDTAGAPPGNVAATAVTLGSPLGVAVDSHGNILLADQDNNVVRAVAGATGTFYGQAMTAGRIYTVMGNVDGVAGQSGEGRDGPLGVDLDDPNGVAVDALGDIVVSDTGNDAVQLYCDSPGFRYGVSMKAGIVYTIAGGGTEGDVTQGGQALAAGLTSPDGVAFDRYGNVIVSDTGDDLVRVVPQTSGTYYGQAMQAGDIYTIAGINGDYGYSGNGRPGALAAISIEPFDGLATDAQGDVVFPDADNNVIRLVAASGGTRFGVSVRAGDIYTIVGNGGDGYTDKKPALKTQISAPQGVAFDAAGDLLVSDAGNNVVRLVPAANETYAGAKVKKDRVYTIAGESAASGYTGNGGPATAAEMDDPAGIAVAPSGQVVVADNGNNVVRVLTAVTAPTQAKRRR
ncbi:MAG TPA: hypothetical protein VMB72_13855 [Acidimicrobiales bacterium]|nr:hypothetical protein [Acidimicrobiales bacterium]